MTLGLLVASENVSKVYPIGGFLTLDHMGPPPFKNQNFAWENANKHTDTQTHKIHVLQV